MDEIKLPERPDLSIELEDGRKIKMTYGLEMDLRRLLPDPTTAMQLVMHDPFTQDYVIRRCLTEKKGMVQDIKELDPEVEMDPDDTEKLLLWAVSHVLYFFVKRAAAMGQLAAQYQVTLPKVSETGSESSASTTPSAGPSE